MRSSTRCSSTTCSSPTTVSSGGSTTAGAPRARRSPTSACTWGAARRSVAVSAACSTSLRDGGLTEDTAALAEAGDLVARDYALSVLGYRLMLSALGGADPSGSEASVRKLLGVEHDQRVQEVGLALLRRCRRDRRRTRGRVVRAVPLHPQPHHRGRDLRDPAQHHRRARARPPEGRVARRRVVRGPGQRNSRPAGAAVRCCLLGCGRGTAPALIPGGRGTNARPGKFPEPADLSVHDRLPGCPVDPSQ